MCCCSTQWSVQSIGWSEPDDTWVCAVIKLLRTYVAFSWNLLNEHCHSLHSIVLLSILAPPAIAADACGIQFLPLLIVLLDVLVNTFVVYISLLMWSKYLIMCISPSALLAVTVHNLRINPQPAVQNDTPEPMVSLLFANIRTSSYAQSAW